MNIRTSDAADEVAAIIRTFAKQLRDVAKPLALVVRFEVEHGHGQKVESAFAEAVLSTRAEPGCLAFQVNREAGSPRRFVVYERWRSLADLEAHLRTDYVSRLRAAIDDVIVGEPEFRIMEPLSR
jgi:quinol monooxygenase YgiN